MVPCVCLAVETVTTRRAARPHKADKMVAPRRRDVCVAAGIFGLKEPAVFFHLTLGDLKTFAAQSFF
jgi:hypothetical protein